MKLVGIALLVTGIALMRFLEPKVEDEAMQLELWPKVTAILFAVIGAIFLIFGIMN